MLAGLMSVPPIAAVHHVKLPVSDLARSRRWYETVLGLRVVKEFVDDDGVVRGLSGELLDAEGARVLSVSVRQNPPVAAGLSGFDPLSVSIADPDVWRGHLGQVGVEFREFGHAPVLAVQDPDGLEIRLFGPGG